MRTAVTCMLVCLGLLASACTATPTITAASRAAAASATDQSVAIQQAAIESAVTQPAAAALQASTTGCDLNTARVLAYIAGSSGDSVTFVAPQETVSRLLPLQSPGEIANIDATERVVCVTEIVEDSSQVACGWHMQNGTLTEVRHESWALRFSAYPLGPGGSRHDTQPMQVFQECSDDVDSPDVWGSVAESIDLRPPIWDQDIAEIALGEIATWTVALSDQTSLATDDCTQLVVLQDRLEQHASALVDFLEVESAWQPIADDWSPDPTKYLALQDQVRNVRGIGLGASLSAPRSAAETLSTASLAAILWMGFPEPGELETNGNMNPTATYRVEAGRRLGRTLQGPYHTDLVTSLVTTLCDGQQLQTATETAAQVANPDAVGVCIDLKRVYDARALVRAEAVKDPAERHHDLRSVIEPIFDVSRSIFENWTVGGNPFFDNNAVWSLYTAESSLVSLVVERQPMNVEEITLQEDFAAPMHAFASAQCPDITQGIDLPSVLTLVDAPPSEAVSQAQTNFCAHADSMLQARVDFWSLIDPSGAAQPWTPQAAELFQTIMDDSEQLSRELVENKLLVNPNAEYVQASTFAAIRTMAVNVRLAHFGPVIVPMQRPEVEPSPYETDEELYFLRTLCGASDAKVAAFTVPLAELPGPMYERSGYDALPEDLCPLFTMALVARRGFRAVISDAAAGDQFAMTTATSYHERFASLADWSQGFTTVLGEVVGEDETAAYDRSLKSVDDALYAALIDQALEWQIRDFEDDLALRDQLFETVESRCGAIDAALLTTTEADTALLDELIELHELPAVVSVERLCIELEIIYIERANLRDKLALGRAYQADEVLDRIGEVYGALVSYDVELPAGFDASWLDAMRRNEGQLQRRARYGTPIEVELVNERLPKVALLEDYIGTNCPNIEAGLDLVPVLDVYGIADAGAVAEAQAEFCVAVDALFEARLGFRAVVPSEPGPFTDEARAAYDLVLTSTEEIRALLDAKEILINPEGLDFGGYRVSSIEREESLLRQTFFEPYNVPRVESDYEGDPAGEHTAAFAKLICESTSDALDTPVASVQSFGGPTIAAFSLEGEAAAAEFCVRLEASRRAELAVLYWFTQAATGDEQAKRDALRFYPRISRFQDGVEDSIEVLFPEAANSDPNDNLIYNGGSFVLFQLKKALQNDAGYRARERLESTLAKGRQLEPAVLAHCAHLPKEILDLSVPADEMLALFDALDALK